MALLDFAEKRKLRRIVYSKPVAFVLFVIVCVLGYGTFGMYQTAREAESRRAAAAAEYAELESREQFLKSEIERLQTDRGIEAEVRSKFDVAREGEKVIVIIDETEKEDENAGKVKEGWFRKIKTWFE